MLEPIFMKLGMYIMAPEPISTEYYRNIPGGKGRPARKVDNLIDICEPIV
jgi:hypothetical protein